MDNEKEIKAVLDLANEQGKFAIQVGHVLSQEKQDALEELLITGRVRLIDVTVIALTQGLFRVFIADERRRKT